MATDKVQFDQVLQVQHLGQPLPGTGAETLGPDNRPGSVQAQQGRVEDVQVDPGAGVLPVL